jgi:bifunctional DNA-binding transcriptional regulator/antitoxin component of YhaV-PrlF toxin-antitoxin module
MVIEVRPGTVVRLRRKNQLTVPETVLAEIGAAVGDRFLISVEGGAVRLERVLPSYAGALADVYPADWAEQLRKDRDDWRA